MSFQDWIMANEKVVQAVSFYALLLLLLLLEIANPESPQLPDRKKRWVTNFGVSFVGGSLLRILPVTGLLASAWAAKEGFGLLNRVTLPALVVFILTAMTRSLASYALHVVMHKTPVLWRIHRTHHLDTVMDVSTTVRFNPLELFLSFGAGLVTITLLGLPVWALILYSLLESAIRFFSHSNIHLPKGLDRTLRLVISTPAMHRIHHSVLMLEADSNYGVIFSMWDRLFGTYNSPEGKDLAGMRLGQEGNEYSKVQSFWRLLVNPFKN